MNICEMKDTIVLILMSFLLSLCLALFICYNSNANFDLEKYWYVLLGITVFIEICCCCCYYKFMNSPPSYTTTYVVQRETKIVPVSTVIYDNSELV